MKVCYAGRVVLWIGGAGGAGGRRGFFKRGRMGVVHTDFLCGKVCEQTFACRSGAHDTVFLISYVCFPGHCDQYLGDLAKSNSLVSALRQKNMVLFEKTSMFESYKTRALVRYMMNLFESGAHTLRFFYGRTPIAQLMKLLLLNDDDTEPQHRHDHDVLGYPPRGDMAVASIYHIQT